MRHERNTSMDSYMEDFSKLQITIVFGFAKNDDQIAMLNQLIIYCVHKQYLSHYVNLTSHIVPWMRDPSTVQAIYFM